MPPSNIYLSIKLHKSNHRVIKLFPDKIVSVMNFIFQYHNLFYLEHYKEKTFMLYKVNHEKQYQTNSFELYHLGESYEKKES